MKFPSGIYMEKLHALKESSGIHFTEGLEDKYIMRFIAMDPSLSKAIDKAFEVFEALNEDEKNLIKMDEPDLCKLLQDNYVNFYPADGINPYVPLAASGPWIVTTHGAILHDSGGYGMLGMGHAPDEVIDAISAPWVMANVMTPSFSQKRLSELLKKEIGHTRSTCPFSHFICMNSGSEAVTITSRIVDIHAKSQTEPGASHEGKEIRLLALIDGFHGRTSFPARLSHSTRDSYVKHLASYREDTKVDFVEINNEKDLINTYNRAEREGIYYEAMYIEPVMGEGVPGLAISRSFYDLAREITLKNNTLLIVDSIQAALRAQGCLSIVDYPDFKNCEAPDMETYSKALNAGQYPLSVVALQKEAAEIYQTGVYGNTMTTNPRGLEVGCKVLESINDDLRTNIRERGEEFIEKLTKLQEDYPDTIDKVVGTGLLVCALLNPEKYTVTGNGGFEEFLRINGINMIHGGPNGIRFTPHLNISSDEIDMIVRKIEDGLTELR